MNVHAETSWPGRPLMNIPITPLAELERERQRLLDELKEEGSDWAERYKPGSLGCHELLDRTALFAEMAEQCVVSHPASVLNPEWYSLAAQAVAILSDLYQRVGQEHLNKSGEPGESSH